MAYTTINKGSSYFNTKLYTGTGASNSVTGVGFKPDWVWIKRRETTSSHALFDINRGVNKQLRTNNTNAEENVSWFPSFDTDGFTVSTTEADGNASGGTYVAWNWLGSNTTTANTSGTISSTLSVNQTAGFSIVSYTGTGANATVGHGLGVVPKMIFFKRRNTTANWNVYNSTIGATNKLNLNTTDASSASGDFNNTEPTSSVFSVATAGEVNASGSTYIAYCFADVKGYSKIGSYTGNGSTDGTFVYTGFSPAFVMFKRTDSTSGWGMFDNKREPFNLNDTRLLANTTGADDTSTDNGIDFLSNGFKWRTASGWNASASYIYMAFAENPFVSSTSIPTTAR